jgi:capsular exopolysaccharide synthesis family protein
MNQLPHLPGELVRPATDPAAVVAALGPNPLGAFPGSHPAIVTAIPAGTANAMSSMSVLRALRRRQMLALGVAVLLSATCGAAAWYFVPSKYKAQASLQVIAQPPKVLFRTVETEDAGGDYKRYQTTQQTLVKSQMVLTAALGLDDGKISKYRMIRDHVDPIAWLKDELKVEFLTGSEIMEISLSGEDAVEVADVVNAVKRAYMEEVVNVDVKRRTDRRDMLEKLSAKYKELLNQRSNERKKLAEKLGADDRPTLSMKHQYAEESLERLQSEHEDALSRKRKAEAILKAIRSREMPVQVSSAISEDEIGRMVDQDPDVTELADRLAEAMDRMNSEATRVRAVARKRAADYSIQHLQEEVKSLRKRLADSRKQIRPRVIQELQDRLEGTNTSGQSTKYKDAEQEVFVWSEVEQTLREQLQKQTKGREEFTTKTLSLQEIQDDVSSIQEAAKKIVTELESLKVELLAPPRIRPIEDATVPLTKDEKRRNAIIAMIAFGSFFGGLFGVAFLELQTRKVDCADEVPQELGLHVVGGLPILPSRPLAREGSIVTKPKDRYGYDLLLESVDATRTMLVHAARTGSHRVVMITSAVAGEGKSSLASYLAPSMARSGMKTLLVDADLRNPSLHQIFDLPIGPGLSELLRGETSPAAVINETAIENLSIVTGGNCNRQTIHRLAQGCLGSHFVHFKERFDFVIVDSSPVLPVADGLIVAQQVDTVLFSIFRDVSRKTRVSAALQRLQCLGVPILGAVVTGAEGSRYGNQYSYSSIYPSLPDSATNSPDRSSV